MSLRFSPTTLIVVALIVGMSAFAVFLIIKNNAHARSRKQAEFEAQVKETANQIYDNLFTNMRFTEAEREAVRRNGTSDRGWKKTAEMVMAKNPMSLRAFRASRGKLSAFHVFAQITEVEDWGDRHVGSDNLLAFIISEFDGSESGLAFIKKNSPQGQRLLEITKNGKSHPVLVAMYHEQGHSDPSILWVDN